MRSFKNILVTGGAGFIGSCFIRYFLSKGLCEKIVNFDLLTYAADLNNLDPIQEDPRYYFVQGDVCDQDLIEKTCEEYGIDTIVHFAAETHVDNSISSPKRFIETNIMGTFCLLEVLKKNPHIHFHHISTDEVYGSLSDEGFFSETSAYLPNSPYSAAKASSDHLVRAYHKTYGISITMSHCSNNYGPCQHREKLIPLMLNHCLEDKPLPIYGEGKNIRDWLYVEDHIEAIWVILQKGISGEVYDIGADQEMSNIELVKFLIKTLANELKEPEEKYLSLISYVEDRLGHDYRYAIDCSKLKRLGWVPKYSLEEGLKKTVLWYLQKACVV